MRSEFRGKLDALVIDLGRTAGLAGRMMTNATIALHQADLALAGLVITNRNQMNAMLDEMEQHCITLLALQAPVAGDLRVVIAALRAVGHLRRMGDLARHIAVLARLKHPKLTVSGKVRPVLARMSLLASQLAEDAAVAIQYHDPLSAHRLAEADEEVDALRRHLFDVLFAEDWSDGVEQAVDAALIGRYYERFADHAVAIAREVCYLATGRIPEPCPLGKVSGSAGG
ncbi:MAG: phosphate signaling complex protein PhoU [Actinomycetota bacterium]|nr:phosphate signaling complex protein PhoU [Actinomycetota bacterium]